MMPWSGATKGGTHVGQSTGPHGDTGGKEACARRRARARAPRSSPRRYPGRGGDPASAQEVGPVGTAESSGLGLGPQHCMRDPPRARGGRGVGPPLGVLAGSEVDNDRMSGRPPLERVDPSDGQRILRIGGKAVNRLGGHRDRLAGAQLLDGVIDGKKRGHGRGSNPVVPDHGRINTSVTMERGSVARNASMSRSAMAMHPSVQSV